MENQRYTIPMLEKIAELVIKEFNCGDNVDVIRLANQLGFQVYQTDFVGNDNIAGKLEKNSTVSRILVNRYENPARKRFTIAHEIGHIILHNDNNMDFVDYRNNGKYDQREFEADNFAAALLMPRAKSTEIWHMCCDVDDFAAMMGVSKTAAAIRLNNLGLIS